MAKPTLDRKHIEAAARPQQVAAAGKARQGLVDRSAAAQVQEPLGRHWDALGLTSCVAQDCFFQPFHGMSAAPHVEVAVTPRLIFLGVPRRDNSPLRDASPSVAGTNRQGVLWM